MAEACRVTLEVSPKGIEQAFTSDQMRALVEKAADQMARDKTEGAAKHLHGKMPDSGLYSYRMKLGRHTWLAVLYPTNRAAYAIARKYGVKNL